MERTERYTASHRTRTTFAVGVDPGLSCGLSIVRGDGFRVHIQQDTPERVLDDVATRFPFLCWSESDVLVGCERFVQDQTNHRSAQPVPLQVIGVVQGIARLHQWELHLQAPADAKRLVPNDDLRRLGLYVTGRDVGQRDAHDANDATRHAITVLALRRPSLYDRLLDDIGV